MANLLSTKKGKVFKLYLFLVNVNFHCKYLMVFPHVKPTENQTKPYLLPTYHFATGKLQQLFCAVCLGFLHTKSCAILRYNHNGITFTYKVALCGSIIEFILYDDFPTWAQDSFSNTFFSYHFF